MRGLKKRGQLPAQVLIENVMGFLSANSAYGFSFGLRGLIRAWLLA